MSSIPAVRADCGIDLSIVIPTFNEHDRLAPTLSETVRWCEARGLRFEIIVADDGSTDGTTRLARQFAERDGRIRSLEARHEGKGAAVRRGMLSAVGRVVAFMDADLSTPLDEAPKLLAALERGCDVAIGSRVARRRGEIRVDTRLHRRAIGRVFAFLVNVLAVGGIADTQCGFKFFRREAAAAIFPLQKLRGFSFDVELLFIARRLGLSVAEIPVNWNGRPGSKVNLVVDSLRMLRDVVRLRSLHRRIQREAGPRTLVEERGARRL